MHTADAGMHTTDAGMHTADASMYAAVLKVHGPNELTKHCETSCFIFTSERKGHSRKGSVPTVRAQQGQAAPGMGNSGLRKLFPSAADPGSSQYQHC